MAWQRDVTWRRVDERGQERAVIVCDEGMCACEGLGAVAINGSGLVFEYRMQMTADWSVRQATVIAHLGGEDYSVTLEHRDDGGWYINGARAMEYDQCTDLDLSFSPVTNSITIKRLSLAIGEKATSTALYVSEPELKLSVLDQTYRRVADRAYEYRAGDFRCTIEVDDDQLVARYPEHFEISLEAVIA